MNEVIVNETAGDIDVYRAVGRFEAIPDEFINACRDVQRVIAWRAEAEARDLLAGMCRHYLVEICNWLEKLDDTLHDRVAELHRRG